MPRAISPDKVALLQPIIERIDAQLARPQSDRLDIPMQFASKDAAKQCKGWIESYKQNARTDWKLKFIMRVKDNKLTIEFNSIAKHNFVFLDEHKPENAGLFEFLETKDQHFVGDPLIWQMSDMEAAQKAVMDRPAVIILDPTYLSAESLAYFQDPQGNKATALANALDRIGYKWKYYSDRIRFSFTA